MNKTEKFAFGSAFVYFLGFPSVAPYLVDYILSITPKDDPMFAVYSTYGLILFLSGLVWVRTLYVMIKSTRNLPIDFWSYFWRAILWGEGGMFLGLLLNSLFFS